MRAAQALVHVDHRGDGPRRRPHQVERAAVALLRRQRLRGPRRRRRQPLGVPQPLALGQERRLLGGVEGRRVGRRHQLLQVGPLPLRRLAPGARRRQRAVDPGEPPPQHPQPLRHRHDVRPGEGVEHGQLARRAHQPPVLVLGREPHERPRERRDRVAGRRLAVDHGPRPALRRDPPRQDHLVLVLRQLAERQRRVVVLQALPEPGRQRDLGLHQRLLRAGPHRPRVGGRPGQQAERLRQDRLAGPGLPRDRREPARRRQLGPLDDDEVADLQAADHDRPNFSR